MDHHYHRRKGIQPVFGTFWLLILYLSMAVMPAISHAAETYQFLWKLPDVPWNFSSPVGVAVDAGGNVYVADTGNHRIQKFDSSGNFVAEWGSYGSGNGQFNYPGGVAVDSGGNVYVADSYVWYPYIQKFDSSGNFIAVSGGLGSGNGQFSYPRGVAVDNGGNVYVADMGNHRIQKFGLACVDHDGDGYGNPGNALCQNGGATDCDDSNASGLPWSAGVLRQRRQ